MLHRRIESHTCFKHTLEDVLRQTKLNKKNIIIMDGIQIITYANDLTVVANRIDDLIKP